MKFHLVYLLVTTLLEQNYCALLSLPCLVHASSILRKSGVLDGVIESLIISFRFSVVAYYKVVSA